MRQVLADRLQAAREAPPGRRSPASAPGRRPIVLLLGPDHDDVALTARILGLLGIDLLDTEQARVADIHDRMLGLFRNGDAVPFDPFGIDGPWWAEPGMHPLRRELAEVLAPRLESRAVPALPEPRTAHLLPVWQQVCDVLGLVPRIVLCLSNPGRRSAASQRVQGPEPALNEFRWLSYLVDLYRNCRADEICTIETENWAREPWPQLRRLTGFLEIEEDLPEAELRTALAALVGDDGHGVDTAEPRPRQPLVRWLYELARAAPQDAAARARIDQAVEQFVAHRQLYRPLLQQLERQAAEREADVAAAGEAVEVLHRKLALTESALEQQHHEDVQSAEALRRELALREAALGEAGRRADETAMRIHQLLTKCTELQAARDAAVSDAVAPVLDEAEGLRRQLADAEKSLAEALELARSRAEDVGELRSAFMEQKAAAAALARLEQEVAAQDATLSEAVGRAEELARALRSAEMARDEAEATLALAREETAEQRVLADAACRELQAMQAKSARPADAPDPAAAATAAKGIQPARDLILGCFTNYDWDTIQYWVNSIDRCGFAGDRAVVFHNADEQAIARLGALGFMLYPFDPGAVAGSLAYGYPFEVMAHRFCAYFEFLEQLATIDAYRYVIATDVRDVVFQSNPSAWLETNMGEKKICASCESLRYRDEPWGDGEMRRNYPLLYRRMAPRPIWNAGVQAGDIRVMRDFWLQLNTICAASREPSDQAAYNILLSLRPWSEITLFAMSEDGWACQAGTTVAPHRMDDFRPHLLEPEPRWDGAYATTSTGKRHVILHQYDREPHWLETVQRTYRSAA